MELENPINGPDNVDNSEDKTYRACRPVIRTKYEQMTPAYRKIADYLLLNPAEVIRLSITELADRVGVGEATVSRFCRMLGMRGFQDLKVVLAQEIAPSAVADYSSPLGDLQAGSIKAVANRIRNVVDTTTRFFDEDLADQAVDLMINARKIDFYGVGASAITALDAEHRFLRIGMICAAYIDPHVQAISATLLTPDDVAVAFTHSGSTKDILASLQLAKESGAKTICVTSSSRSPIAQVAEIVLLASVGETTIVTSLYSKIGQLLVLERLFAGCMLKRPQEAHSSLEKTTKGIIDKMF